MGLWNLIFELQTLLQCSSNRKKNNLKSSFNIIKLVLRQNSTYNAKLFRVVFVQDYLPWRSFRILSTKYSRLLPGLIGMWSSMKITLNVIKFLWWYKMQLLPFMGTEKKNSIMSSRFPTDRLVLDKTLPNKAKDIFSCLFLQKNYI